MSFEQPNPDSLSPTDEQGQESTTTLVTPVQTGSEQTEPPRLQIKFDFFHWASSGLLRVLYRGWTRLATRLFPENSRSERIAWALHLPLPDQLNLSWVTDQLAVGGRIRPEDIRSLRKRGVTHVIDTRSEYKDDEEALAKEQIGFLYLPTPDTYPLSVEHLIQGARWANQQIDAGGRVLIHCEHGVGRSVLLTCAVLVGRGMHAHDALELVQSKRWQAAPNHRQIERLREFEADYLVRCK